MKRINNCHFIVILSLFLKTSMIRYKWIDCMRLNEEKYIVLILKKFFHEIILLYNFCYVFFAHFPIITYTIRDAISNANECNRKENRTHLRLCSYLTNMLTMKSFHRMYIITLRTCITWLNRWRDSATLLLIKCIEKIVNIGRSNQLVVEMKNL